MYVKKITWTQIKNMLKANAILDNICIFLGYIEIKLIKLWSIIPTWIQAFITFVIVYDVIRIAWISLFNPLMLIKNIFLISSAFLAIKFLNRRLKKIGFL